MNAAYTFACPSGGTIGLNGTVNGGNAFTFNVALDYNSCTYNGTTIDGSLNYSGSGNGASSFSIMMDGNLNFSGNINGSCAMNLTVATNGTTVSGSGNICGYAFTI